MYGLRGIALIILFLSYTWTAKASLLTGKVVDALGNAGIAYASIVVVDANGKVYHAMTDTQGTFHVTNIAKGHYSITVSFIGYEKRTEQHSSTEKNKIVLRLTPNSKVLNEVIVTARESQGITSSSIIDRKAIEHIQPSSFSDLLALLPGGATTLPNLTQANTIHLRQAGTGNSNYDISSLGTAFVTDGISMSSNANMQQVKQASCSMNGDPDAGRNHVGKGIDMRTIPTDNIESVEVIRGIAPVEYGDLTSGVVLIRRKLAETPIEARFKADSYSKLLFVGKGLRMGNLVNYMSIDYLNAKADPRNTLTNFQRLSLSTRMQDSWELCKTLQLNWRSSIDYMGSFDNEKHDAEILKHQNDRYRSSYNQIKMSHSLSLMPLTPQLLQLMSLNIALSYEKSTIIQDKEVNLSRDIAVNTSIEAGEHDGTFLPYHYLAQVEVDGRPLNFFAKFKALLKHGNKKFSQSFDMGMEWKIDKNFGHGQVYDPSRPINPGTPYRPRNYSEIPAQHQLAFFLQDHVTITWGKYRLTMVAGMRSMKLMNLPHKFFLNKHLYIDPRINVQWQFTRIRWGNRPILIDLNAGWGCQTKFPTLLQLYPDHIYNDLIELNYYHFLPQLRRFHVRTYDIDPTNYSIAAARNNKWEVRMGVMCNDNRLSITYFHENMASGFRTSSIAVPHSYRDYHEEAIDPHATTSPDIATLPYTDKVRLDLYGKTTNGSQLIKEGIEFQLSSKRFKTLKTRLTTTGAWFKTTYTNSEPMFRTSTSAIVNGVAVNDLYMGFYDYKTGNISEQLSSNFMTDTYFPQLGLAFSITAECLWYTSSRSIRENGIPKAYMATDGKMHAFHETDKTNPYLQWLVVNFNEAAWLTQRVPFGMYMNLKVTKDFGQWLKLAFFINRMVDYLPSYKTNSGLLVRRTSKPFFGMEMNIKI